MSTRMLIQRIWDRRSRRRALAVLLVADVCLLVVGGYLIVSWIQIKDQASRGVATGPAHAPVPDGDEQGDRGGPRESEITTGRDPAARRPARGRGGEPRGHGKTSRLPSRRIAATKTAPAPSRDVPRGDARPTGASPDVSADAAIAESSLPDDRPGPSGREPDAGEAIANKRGKDTGSSGKQSFLLAARKRLRMRRKAIKACYHEALKLRSKRLSGVLQLKFELRANGSVESVSCVRNTTGSSVLAKCIAKAVSRIRFPKPPAGIREFLYPISFKATR
jgi:hypothetical protein